MWLTFKQALDLGGHVRKGESGFPVCKLVKAKCSDADELDEDNPDTYYKFLKYWTVFNLDQIQGIDEAIDFDPLPESERVPTVERFIENTGADIEEGCAGACYLPSQDRIQLPDWKRFKAAPLAYTTALHELAHWTGHPCRLDREGMDADFGEHAYAAEEVIAEMAAAFVASDLQLPLEYERPATYLKSWLECLKEDSRAIFRAASSAQDVADYLHGLQDEDIRVTA
jgi:antirestriction protein ArdC